MVKKIGALLLVSVIGTAIPTRADVPVESNATDTTTDKALAKVQGKWVRTVRTPNGLFKIEKEHKGNNTTVTFFDSEKKIAEAKTSEFRLERSGKVRIFTFFNNVVTVGPHKGRTDNEPHSYIYRVVGNKFVEVNGLLIGDDGPPSAFTWKRVKE